MLRKMFDIRFCTKNEQKAYRMEKKIIKILEKLYVLKGLGQKRGTSRAKAK